MTAPYDYDDQAADYPAEPVRGPITLGRERRILAALRAVGPLTEAELCDFVGLKLRKLGKPLVNLALSGQVECSRRSPMFGPEVRTWRLAVQADASDSPARSR